MKLALNRKLVVYCTLVAGVLMFSKNTTSAEFSPAKFLSTHCIRCHGKDTQEAVSYTHLTLPTILLV